MFGEEDAMTGRDYTTTIKCLSARGVVLSVEANEFIERLGRDNSSWVKL